MMGASYILLTGVGRYIGVDGAFHPKIFSLAKETGKVDEDPVGRVTESSQDSFPVAIFCVASDSISSVSDSILKQRESCSIFKSEKKLSGLIKIIHRDITHTDSEPEIFGLVRHFI